MEEVKSVTRTVSTRIAPCTAGRGGCLAAHRDAGRRIVLATSAPEHGAEAACALLGITDHVATQLVMVCSGGCQMGLGDLHAGSRVGCTGRYRPVYKLVYGLGDRQCAPRACGASVAVHPDGPLRRLARRNGWPIVNWDVAD